MVGYASQEVEVYDLDAPLRVLLTEDVSYIEEVVVVGYGTQKRKELTGAVASVSKSVLDHPTTSLDKLLGGAVAGVSVSQVSGQPGAGASVRIRGGNSITASNDPLYVVDGFIFYSDASSTKAGIGGIEGSLNPLAAINPSDIESIEVLKDVSATAIYGSRGANGVVIVTTKKGKHDAASLSYQYSVGWDAPAKQLPLLNAAQWAQMQKDFFLNKGQYTDEEIALLGEGTDWQKAVLRTGASQTHEISLSGGSDQLRYALAGSYTDQSGIVLNSGFERYSARVNIDRGAATDKLTVGVTATAGRSTQNSLTTFEDDKLINGSPFQRGIANSLTYALYMPPVVPIYAEDGGYNYDNPFEYSDLVRDGISPNPVSDLNNSTGQTVNTTLLGNAYARYAIAGGLAVKVSAGVYASSVTQSFFAPSYSALGLTKIGIGAIGGKRQTVSQAEYMLTYAKQLGERHQVDLLGGYTYQRTQTNHSLSRAEKFINEDLGANNLADGAIAYVESGASKSDLHSLLGRVNYSLLGRYNLTATIRGDKSSRFAKNHRWGYFPSVGLSWNVNEESFLKGLRTIDALKLRLTCGTVGNQEIGDYEYAQTFTASRYNGGTAYSQSNLGNKNLKWETTAQYNAGVDAGLLGDRLTLAADVYYKKTSDLLLEAPVNPALGTTQLVNVGNVTNKGAELAVSVTLLERKNLKWSLAANVARNVNRITKLNDEGRIVLGRNEEEILQVGQSLGTFFGLVFDGIVQEGEDIALLPATGYGSGAARPGDLKMADLGGPNGTPDGAISSYDRVPLGSSQPDLTYGLQATLSYRDFDIFISLQGSQGNKVYNYLRRHLESPGDLYNASSDLLGSWTPENPSNVLPGLQNVAEQRIYGYLDSRYVEDASFLRLQNLTIGYTLKLPRTAAGRMRIFASAQNLFVLTAYRGYDPEVARGIDLGVYPTARTFSGGVKITF
jgi:TonB-linked SusC/RagA family outer membrane protein